MTDEEGPVGWVVAWYGLSTSPETRALIEDLIGSDSRLYLGNAWADLWTDLSAVVAGPTAMAPEPGVLEYTRSGAGGLVGGERGHLRHPMDGTRGVPAG